MKLDRTLSAELRKLNGDGSREYRFATLKKVRDARKMLSSPSVSNDINECIKTHGRAITAVCIASTLISRRDRIENYGYEWAKAVTNLWTNRGNNWLEEAVIEDGLHPTRICEYAESFISLTTE